MPAVDAPPRAAAPAAAARPVLDAAAAVLRPHDPAFLHDPYPAYRALREAGPLHRSDAYFDGAWVVSRHADVEAVLRDDRTYSARRTGGWVMRVDGDDGGGRTGRLAFQRLFARALIFLDAPDHQRLRGVLDAGFRPQALQRLLPFIARRVEELLDAADADAGFDFMQAVARPLPAAVIAELLGVAGEDRERFVGWSDELAAFIGSPRPGAGEALRAQAALAAMAAHFEAMAAGRRAVADDGGDLVGRLLAAGRDGRVRDGAELLAQCAMLLFAGHETTRNLLGNGLRALLAHPAEWRRLRESPGLVRGAVRELLRYDSPVQYSARRVACDTLLHGRRLRRGELVVALIGAACRDPRRHDDPDRLDVARAQPGALAFGHGPHVCIGAALTLMEAEAVFAALLRRWPDLALADATAPPRWNANPVYRGLVRLDVRRAPAGG